MPAKSIGRARWAQLLALLSITNAVILPPVLPKEYSYFLRQDYYAESLERPGECCTLDIVHKVMIQHTFKMVYLLLLKLNR
jgi:hypothetical protein